jgi:phenylalanyl-tRNA synthetase alpha chain
VVDRIEQIKDEASKAITGASTTGDLEEIRVRYLGRKAELTGILRRIAELPADQRGPVGKAGNETRVALEEMFENRGAELDASEIGSRLAEDAIDVTLPGSPPAPAGSRNLLIRTMREIEDIFIGLGYRVMEGPEVELDYYNFTALNHPPGHPARMAQDTFYVDPETLRSDLRIPRSTSDTPAGASRAERGEVGVPREDVAADGGLPPGPEDVVLRTHTSPMQVRAMEAQEPPIFIVVPGRCYRSDPFDATHSPIFHQVEGLAVAEDVTLADLKGTLDEFARAIFGPERETRFRPGFFPFTEPSVEVDVSCFRCGGSGQLPDGSRDPLCKGIGWIEILGAGMVDPNVFGFVKENGYDPDRVQGFAFGMGIERIAMLKHGVPDLRKFFENDVRVLEQFR